MFNELAKAISFFQEAIEDGEKLIKNCNSETQAELAEQQQHFIVAIAAMQLILSDPKTALRLQKAMYIPKGNEVIIDLPWHPTGNRRVNVAAIEIMRSLITEETANE